MTEDDATLAWAHDVIARHHPANQGHGYERCALCDYTRHPCETYDLAHTIVDLLARLTEHVPPTTARGTVPRMSTDPTPQTPDPDAPQPQPDQPDQPSEPEVEGNVEQPDSGQTAEPA